MRKYNADRFYRSKVKALFTDADAAAAVENAVADGVAIKSLYSVPAPKPKPTAKGFYSGRRFL